MPEALAAPVLDQLFFDARTYRGSAQAWLDRDVPDALLVRLYDTAKMGPTSANCSPMRVVFVRTPAAKEKLRETLDAGNVAQTMAAPVTAIIASDHSFYDQLPKLFPFADARSWFAGNDALIETTAFRNGSLQGGYFILAARALGLDCGPMSGFDNARLDAAFFAGSNIRSNFLVNLGYGDRASLSPRSPRLDFAEACRIA